MARVKKEPPRRWQRNPPKLDDLLAEREKGPAPYGGMILLRQTARDLEKIATTGEEKSEAAALRRLLALHDALFCTGGGRQTTS